MLNLERLRLLHAVATHGSVSEAAVARHVTTSAASQQLAKLEHEVGQKLLERNGRGIRLTDAAELLVEHARGIFSLVEQTEADMEAHRNAVVGRVSIAAFATAARGLAPAALRELSERHPKLRVELAEMEPHEALPLLARGDIDLAVVQDWPNAPLTISEVMDKAPLMEDVFDVALAADHPLAGRDTVGIGELAAETWISWPSGQICHDWLLHAFRSRGIEPQIAHTATEHATQLALVAARLGVALLPRLGRDPVPDSIRIVALQAAPRRHIYSVWRADSARRPGIRVTLEALKTSASMLAPSAA